MTSRSSRLRAFPSPDPGGRPRLLFVHGGYTHSACWLKHFIPFFQAEGYDCHALDLSGHGAGSGQDRLDEFGLEDYAGDLAEAVATLGRPSVLIGHSMGALVVQRYLEKGTAAGMALLSPVPPSGTAGSAMRLAFANPAFFSALSDALGGKPSNRSLEALAQVFFSPRTDLAEVARFLPMLQAESHRAVMEMLAPTFWGTRPRPNIPALVMGGSEDAVFPASLLRFSAAPWHARLEIIPEAGHMLMLDPRWRDSAGRLLAWLDEIPIHPIQSSTTQ